MGAERGAERLLRAAAGVVLFAEQGQLHHGQVRLRGRLERARLRHRVPARLRAAAGDRSRPPQGVPAECERQRHRVRVQKRLLRLRVPAQVPGQRERRGVLGPRRVRARRPLSLQPQLLWPRLLRHVSRRLRQLPVQVERQSGVLRLPQRRRGRQLRGAVSERRSARSLVQRARRLRRGEDGRADWRHVRVRTGLRRRGVRAADFARRGPRADV